MARNQSADVPVLDSRSRRFEAGLAYGLLAGLSELVHPVQYVVVFRPVVPHRVAHGCIELLPVTFLSDGGSQQVHRLDAWRPGSRRERLCGGHHDARAETVTDEDVGPFVAAGDELGEGSPGHARSRLRDGPGVSCDAVGSEHPAEAGQPRSLASALGALTDDLVGERLPPARRAQEGQVLELFRAPMDLVDGRVRVARVDEAL